MTYISFIGYVGRILCMRGWKWLVWCVNGSRFQNAMFRLGENLDLRIVKIKIFEKCFRRRNWRQTIVVV